MSVPLLFTLESSNSENNANLNKKLNTNSENYEEKNKYKYMKDINNHVTKQIYLFKDEILKDINEIIEKLFIKISSNFKVINEELSKNSEKFNFVNERIDKIKEKIIKYEPYEEKIKELFANEIKNEKNMSSHLVKFDDIKNEIRQTFVEYEGILKKYKASDITEELVGDKRKFKTYPELMKYLYNNISSFNSSKQRNNLEFVGYKTKLDSTIAGFKNQINSVIDSMQKFTKNNIKESEERIKGIINLFDERIVEIRSEIKKNSIEKIKKENNNFFNEKVEEIKKENNNFFNEKVEEIKKIMNRQKDSEILNFNCLLKTIQNNFEEKISKYNEKYHILKQDLDNFKLNEDKKFELLKEEKESNKNNTNQENMNPRTDSKKNLTQKNFYKLSQNLISNESSFEKLKQNLLSSIRNAINGKNSEIKIHKEKKYFENPNKSFDNRIFEGKNISLIKKKLENKTVKRTLNKYAIEKKINYFGDIKDINNNEDAINKSMKNKELPKIEEFKKEDIVNHFDSNQSSKIKLKNLDKKAKISSNFMNNKERLQKKILSTTITLRKKSIKEKINDNTQTNLNFTNYIPEKKVNDYDISFKPFKDFNKNKIVKIEENKNLSQSNIKNSQTNKHSEKITKIKQKSSEYEYINSKGEISNIIEMPPPEEALHKSIFTIKDIYNDIDKSI